MVSPRRRSSGPLLIEPPFAWSCPCPVVGSPAGAAATALSLARLSRHGGRRRWPRWPGRGGRSWPSVHASICLPGHWPMRWVRYGLTCWSLGRGCPVVR